MVPKIKEDDIIMKKADRKRKIGNDVLVNDMVTEEHGQVDIHSSKKPKKEKKPNSEMKERLAQDDLFITDLVSLIYVPKHKSNVDDDEDIRQGI